MTARTRKDYDEPEIVMPTPERIRNCESFGWEYIGEGFFTKDEWLGWFTPHGWEKG